MRADLTWLGCLGTDEICQEHAKTIGDYISHGGHAMLAATHYTNIAISTVEQVGEPMMFCTKAAAARLGIETMGEPGAMCSMVHRVAGIWGPASGLWF